MKKLKNITDKIQSNLSIYQQEFQEKGLDYLISARMKKFPITRRIYYLFRPNKINTMGMTIYVDKQDTVVSESLLQHGRWEPFETALIQKYANADSIVVDIGSHIGYHTLIAAKTVGTHGRVFSFEPDPHNFSYLMRNIAINKCNNIIAINKAVGKKNGEAELFLNKENQGDHQLFDSGEQRESVIVSVTSLDSFFRDYPKERNQISLIKMDIQGYEAHALTGMQNILEINPNAVLITEFWPYGIRMAGSAPKTYLKQLKDLGFYIYKLDEEKQLLATVNPFTLQKQANQSKDFAVNLLCTKRKVMRKQV